MAMAHASGFGEEVVHVNVQPFLERLVKLFGPGKYGLPSKFEASIRDADDVVKGVHCAASLYTVLHVLSVAFSEIDCCPSSSSRLYQLVLAFHEAHKFAATKYSTFEYPLWHSMTESLAKLADDMQRDLVSLLKVLVQLQFRAKTLEGSVVDYVKQRFKEERGKFTELLQMELLKEIANREKRRQNMMRALAVKKSKKDVPEIELTTFSVAAAGAGAMPVTPTSPDGVSLADDASVHSVDTDGLCSPVLLDGGAGVSAGSPNVVEGFSPLVAHGSSSSAADAVAASSADDNGVHHMNIKDLGIEVSDMRREGGGSPASPLSATSPNALAARNQSWVAMVVRFAGSFKNFFGGARAAAVEAVVDSENVPPPSV